MRNSGREGNLEQVLRDMPWSAPLVPLAFGLFFILLAVAAVVIED